MTTLYPLFLEAALRALLAAIAVGAGLRMLRVVNVVVLKAAWAFVLVAVTVMPFATNWLGMPSWTALKLPVMPSPSFLQGALPATATKPIPHAATPTVIADASTVTEPESAPYPSPSISDSHLASIEDSDAIDDSTAAAPLGKKIDNYPQSIAPQSASSAPLPATGSTNSPNMPARIAEFCLLLYTGVAAALILRLLLGLASAIGLWFSARPISMLRDPAWNVRYSPRVASPVNIGSGIVLPAEYSEWDEEKLRIVLAHERSHIRQGDFYLQLLAGFYTAIFWFSPLGWWLKRKLYELGEAISDRAGLEEAASRTSYAQLLLEFAALPRPTLTGVAMARTSHLSQRIERLLNESSFRQAFAASGRRALLAIILVPLALLSATSLVTVQAARPATQTQPAAITGQSAPEQVTDAAPQVAPAPAPAPSPADAPQAAPAPEPAPSPNHEFIVIPAPPAPGAPDDVDGEHIVVIPRVHTPHVVIPDIHIDTHVMPQIAAIPPMPPIPAGTYHFNGRDFKFAYAFGQEGDPYAVVGADGKVQHPNGWYFNDSDRDTEIEKARKQAHGAFLWFQHDGKSYVIEDPSVLAQIDAMNKPMDDLQIQMKDLGKQMRELGEQQREKARSMRDTAVQTPDLSKELEELKAAEAALQAKQGATITQKEVGDLQREIGRIQGELGSLQGKLAVNQMGIGKAMGEFGEQQGKLGSQMGKLGAEMGRIARENHEKVDSIIKDSLSNGKAKQVQ